MDLYLRSDLKVKNWTGTDFYVRFRPPKTVLLLIYLNLFEILIDDLSVQYRILGDAVKRGGFSEVYKAIDEGEQGGLVAVKLIDLNSKKIK